MSSNKVSNVWIYFNNNKNKTVTCKECGDTLSYTHGNTTTLRRHLLTKHRIDVDNTEPESSSKRMKTMDSFLTKTSLEEIVSKLAAIDGFTIRGIAKSEFIRSSLASRGFKLPSNENLVMALIHNFSDQTKKQVIKGIENDLAEMEKFSISLDEWTSTGNRRFLNINLHGDGSKFINLGLVRIVGSCPADKMLELVTNHLRSFGISFKNDIVASTGDGAGVMQSFGRKSPGLYQACLDHALHLGVTKTFYKYNLATTDDSNEEPGETDNFDDDGDRFASENVEMKSESLIENLEIVRKTVKFFKQSAIRSDAFKAKCFQKFNTHKQLSLDCKTRSCSKCLRTSLTYMK